MSQRWPHNTGLTVYKHITSIPIYTCTCNCIIHNSGIICQNNLEPKTNKSPQEAVSLDKPTLKLNQQTRVSIPHYSWITISTKFVLSTKRLFIHIPIFYTRLSSLISDQHKKKIELFNGSRVSVRNSRSSDRQWWPKRLQTTWICNKVVWVTTWNFLLPRCWNLFFSSFTLCKRRPL